MSSRSHVHVHVHVKLTFIHVVLIICALILHHVKAIDIPSTFFADRSSLETSASPIATASVVPISATNTTLPFVSGAGDRTITAWVRFSNQINTSLSTGFFLGLGDKDTCSSKELSFGYSNTENHFIASSCNTSVAEGPLSYKGKLQRGVWYHTAFIYERASSNLTVYVNGESGPVIQLSLDTSTSFVILGARANLNLSSPWTGSIGTITSWSGILTPSEILADLQNTLSLDAQLRAPSGAQLLASLGIAPITPANITHDATYTYTVTRTSAPTAKIDLNTATIRVVNGTKAAGTTTTTPTPTPTPTPTVTPKPTTASPTVTSAPTTTSAPTNTSTPTNTTGTTTTTPPTSTPTPTTVPPLTPRADNTTSSPPTTRAYPPTGSVAPNLLQPQYASIYVFLDAPTANTINEQVEIATFSWAIRAATAIGISPTRVRAIIGQTDKTYVRFDVAGAPNNNLANIMALLQIQLIGADTVFSRDTQGGSIGSVASFRTRTAPTNTFYFTATVCADGTFRDAKSCEELTAPAPQPVATPTFPPITSEKWTETYRFTILIICVVLGGSVLVVLLIFCIYRYNSSDAVFSNHSTHIARQTFDATMDEVEMRNFQANPSIDKTSEQQQPVVVSVV